MNPLVTKQDVGQLALHTDMTTESKTEEEKTDLESSAQENGDQQAKDPSKQYNEHSIPPPATMQLPRTPLTSTREAPESSQASPLSPVTKERLEKKVSEAESERDMFLDQLDHEQRKTTKLFRQDKGS
jgi:hypothetical protein